MLRLAVLLAVAAVVSSSILPTRPERRVADAQSAQRYRQVLEPLVGAGNNAHFPNELADWDITRNYVMWTDERYPREFIEEYWDAGIPKDSVFTLTDRRMRRLGIMLFDMFFFTKDFDTFIRAAHWARQLVHPGMFVWAYTLAVYHRPDTNSFVLPPWYEIVPNFFVPTDTLHRIHADRMSGVKEGHYSYNSSGYEYYPHGATFGGVFGEGNRDHGEYRISYFREDVGLNNFLTDWFHSNPSWMDPAKYGMTWSQRRGENFYYMLQQILARYQLERLANSLPPSKTYAWMQTINVGYNPRVSYLNGKSMYVRPDFFNVYTHNPGAILHAQSVGHRVWETLDFGMLMQANGIPLAFDAENGTEMLGRLMYGTSDRPKSGFYPSLYYTGLDTLSYSVNTGSDHFYVGNALATPFTALRDTLYYEWIGMLIKMFQYHKGTVGPYRHEDLIFKGVTVQNMEVDRFTTYFEQFDYEATNGVPMETRNEYHDHRYAVRTFRLNHKPYQYNITVNAENAGDVIVRVFIGPKYDADDHELSLGQARMAFFEIDRFHAQMTAGVNVWERSSSESPIFVEDQEGFRSLFSSINSVMEQKGEFYLSEAGRCGFPQRLQLPMGWKGGRAHRLAVMVMPFDASQAGSSLGADIACGGTMLYDRRPMGFPFDRPMRDHTFRNIPNFYHRDVLIHHRDEHDMNRPSA